MGVPTSEVGYTYSMPRREDHEVHMDMWGALGERKKKREINTIVFMIHTVQSLQLHILCPEDSQVQRPKHVVSSNKNNNIR